ncbi:SRPBCC family protein [Pseudooceanicola nitratireducens]|uniref:SRPBCC family protein n=1 Tax=Pseudooceanicola nitratireducens TaxID=517719 RepID=UPI0023F2A80F|nr:SRPBCC domain-containing protein [Pseudooceanicola nitratireducens]
MKDTETADVELIRDYAVALTRLWRAVTEPVQILQWFGPEGVYLDDCQMDFRTTGPWSCTMRGKESGSRFKVSGQITHVSPPEGGRGSVGFTWAWHDEDDRRGPESHVSFAVEETTSGARLTLTHRDLASAEAAQDHTRGWLSTLRKMDFFLDPQASLVPTTQ